MSQTFRDLIAWQKAFGLATHVYRLTAGFPAQERYALTVQMRRAAVSVPSNIAEGWGRQAIGDYRRFLIIARASNMELQTQLLIAAELNFGDRALWEVSNDLSHQTGKLLVALIKSLKQP